MARNDKETYDSYQKGPFDNPPAGPVGVHRGSRSLGARITPFAIVLVVAALAGLIFWAVFSGEASYFLHGEKEATSQVTSSASASSSANASDEATATPSEEATAAPSDEASSEASASPSPSESTSSPAATVNYDTDVRVVNGTGVTGYAAQEASVLQNAGFTSVTAANPSGTLPSASVVWYQNETDKATAEKVASALGISTVEQVQDISSPVVAVLMQ